MALGKAEYYRYVYLYLEHQERTYLLYLYPKNVVANLTAQQLKMVANVVDRIKEAVEK